MITQHALTEAIAYYKGKVDPTPSDAIVLAACYTIQDHLNEMPSYSMASAPTPSISAESTIEYNSGTEFARAINGKDPAKVWGIIDELMDGTLKVINPKLYNGVLRQVEA